MHQDVHSGSKTCISIACNRKKLFDQEFRNFSDNSGNKAIFTDFSLKMSVPNLNWKNEPPHRNFAVLAL